MNKLSKYTMSLLLPAALLVGCGEDFEEKLSGSNPESNTVMVDRITGFAQEVTGGGATLTAVGENLSDVKRVLIGQDLILALHVQASSESVSFTVPVNTPIGEQELIFVYAGNEREREVIEVVPLPSVSFVDQPVGSPGEVITVFGLNLDYVSSVMIGEVEASLDEQEGSYLTFTVPEGVTTAPLVLEGGAGVIEAGEFIVCGENPGEPRCKERVNPNGSFEEGELGEVGEIEVPGWELNEGGVSNMAIVADPTRGGRKALEIEIVDIGSNPWDIQATNGTFTVEPNTTYHYSIKVMGPAGARVNFTIGRPNYSEFTRTEVELSGEWEEITQEFTTGADDTEVRLPIHFSIEGNAGSIIYIDDVRVVSLGESGGN